MIRYRERIGDAKRGFIWLRDVRIRLTVSIRFQIVDRYKLTTAPPRLSHVLTVLLTLPSRCESRVSACPRKKSHDVRQPHVRQTTCELDGLAQPHARLDGRRAGHTEILTGLPNKGVGYSLPPPLSTRPESPTWTLVRVLPRGCTFITLSIQMIGPRPLSQDECNGA